MGIEVSSRRCSGGHPSTEFVRLNIHRNLLVYPHRTQLAQKQVACGLYAGVAARAATEGIEVALRGV